MHANPFRLALLLTGVLLTLTTPAVGQRLSREEREEAVVRISELLIERYVFEDVAEACADYLGDAIPGASHIQHMPSHIYLNIGRYGDAVRSNQNAWHVDQQAAYGGPPGVYPSHNLHMLLYAATLDGQSAAGVFEDLSALAERADGEVEIPVAVPVRPRNVV